MAILLGSQQFLGLHECLRHQCFINTSFTFQSPDVEYDGDNENSTGMSSDSNSTSSQKSSLSEYDFQDDDQCHMELSPSTKSTKGKGQRSSVLQPIQSKCDNNGCKEKKPKAKQKKGGKVKNLNKQNDLASETGSDSPMEPADHVKTKVQSKGVGRNQANGKDKKTLMGKDKKNVSFSPIVSDLTSLSLSINKSPEICVKKVTPNIEKCPLPVQKLDLSMTLDQTDCDVLSQGKKTPKRKHDSASVEPRAKVSRVTRQNEKELDDGVLSISKPISSVQEKPQTGKQSAKGKPQKEKQTKLANKGKPQKEKSEKQKPKKKDEGLVSPPSLKQQKLPFLVAKDSSTPTDAKFKPGVLVANDSTFGFSSMPSLLDVSPVQKVAMTPTSDYASMDTSLISCHEKEPAKEVELFMEVEDDDGKKF